MVRVDVGKATGFPVQTSCRCGGQANPAFCIEETDDGMPKVRDLIEGAKAPREYVAVAVYVCGRCGEPVAKMQELPRENGDGEKELDQGRDQASRSLHEEG